MKCVICGEKFYYQTYMEPADPCDCGQCLSEESAEQLQPKDLAKLKADYKHAVLVERINELPDAVKSQMSAAYVTSYDEGGIEALLLHDNALTRDQAVDIYDAFKREEDEARTGHGRY